MMKSLLNILLVAVLVFSTACDELLPNDDGTYQEEKNIDDNDLYKESIIIFEFTGWNCIGCPTGHRMIENLSNTYQERIQAIAVHAGYFAKPGLEGPDFQSEVSNLLYAQFGSPNEFPQGAVHSMNKSDLTAPGVWPAAVEEQYQYIKENAAAKLLIETKVDGDQLITDIKGEYLLDIEEDVKLVLFAVESDIEALQADKDLGFIEDYSHNHVLRATHTGDIQGELITNNPEEGTKWEKTISMNIEDEWYPEHMHVIPMLLNIDKYLIPIKVQQKSNH